MKDRVPTYPGRVTMTPVAGQANTYDLQMADQPTEPGTPLNKANLLTDETAAALGFAQTDDPSVNDAFLKINGNLAQFIAAPPFSELEELYSGSRGSQTGIFSLAVELDDVPAGIMWRVKTKNAEANTNVWAYISFDDDTTYNYYQIGGGTGTITTWHCAFNVVGGLLVAGGRGSLTIGDKSLKNIRAVGWNRISGTTTSGNIYVYGKRVSTT